MCQNMALIMCVARPEFLVPGAWCPVPSARSACPKCLWRPGCPCPQCSSQRPSLLVPFPVTSRKKKKREPCHTHMTHWLQGCPRFKSLDLTPKKNLAATATQESHATASQSGSARTGQHTLQKTIVETYGTRKHAASLAPHRFQLLLRTVTTSGSGGKWQRTRRAGASGRFQTRQKLRHAHHLHALKFSAQKPSYCRACRRSKVS